VFLTYYNSNYRVKTSSTLGYYSLDKNIEKIRVLLLILHVVIYSLLQNFNLFVKGSVFILIYYSVVISVSSIEQNV
jgi:hypothetical protein